MPADATAPGWAPIDVYTDVVPGIGQRGHGQRRVPAPAPTGALEHGYQPPALDFAPIGRPTVWVETAADRDTVLGCFDTLAGARDEVRFGTLDGQRRRGLIVMLDWLAATDGETWQQRWIASGLNDHGSAWTAQITDQRIRPTAHGRATLIGGAAALLLLDVVRPSYRWLFGFLSHPTLAEIQRHRDPDGFARLAELGSTLPGFGPDDQTPAFKHLSRILVHNGGTLADITVADCREAFAAQLAYAVQKRTLWYWLLLHAGTLDADAPRDAHSLMKTGQRTVTELVDGYRVESVEVRAVLIDYLHERQAVLDYTSLAALASKLVLLFWRDLEIHHPGIDALGLDDDMARGWKERLRVVVHGKQRVGQRREDPNAILIAVRAFYTDINHWATEDPSRWGRWAATNPITGRDLVGQNKQKRRSRARMQQRTRELTSDTEKHKPLLDDAVGRDVQPLPSGRAEGTTTVHLRCGVLQPVRQGRSNHLCDGRAVRCPWRRNAPQQPDKSNPKAIQAAVLNRCSACLRPGKERVGEGVPHREARPLNGSDVLDG